MFRHSAAPPGISRSRAFRLAGPMVALGCALGISLIAPAASFAVGPDGQNHTDMSSAYGPIKAGISYSGYNAYSDDQDVYSIRNYVKNGNLVLDVQDQYPNDNDECTFWTTCNLAVNVYDSTGNDITPTDFCVEPGAPQKLLPVTLPTPGVYYIAISTNAGNITCGLGPAQDGQTIPYTFSVQPSRGVGQPIPKPKPKLPHKPRHPKPRHNKGHSKHGKTRSRAAKRH
jgi:hypothetical protein